MIVKLCENALGRNVRSEQRHNCSLLFVLVLPCKLNPFLECKNLEELDWKQAVDAHEIRFTFR